MRKSSYLIALTLLGASTAALGQPQLVLNTGFNHSNFTVYSTSTILGSVSDNYWIKVAASDPPLGVPAFVIKRHNAWQPTLSAGGFGSRYIGSTAPTGASPPSPVPYAIYRKCFCLMRGFKEAKLSFQMRGDDSVQVWLNNNIVVPGQGGSFGGSPITGTAQPSHFRAGVNCLYVLVVDEGGVVTGFNLAGTVSAWGLMSVAAAGANMSFAPCACESGRDGEIDDRATIQAIARTAEERRRKRAAPSPR